MLSTGQTGTLHLPGAFPQDVMADGDKRMLENGESQTRQSWRASLRWCLTASAESCGGGSSTHQVCHTTEPWCVGEQEDVGVCRKLGHGKEHRESYWS